MAVSCRFLPSDSACHPARVFIDIDISYNHGRDNRLPLNRTFMFVHFDVGLLYLECYTIQADSGVVCALAICTLSNPHNWIYSTIHDHGQPPLVFYTLVPRLHADAWQRRCFGGIEYLSMNDAETVCNSDACGDNVGSAIHALCMEIAQASR